jgi:syntaxin 1B/2/3
MDVLVTQQEEVINAIETSATQVQKDTEAGYVTRWFAEFSSNWSCSLGQTEKAVEHARSARRKRWICFLLFIAVLAAVGIAVGVSVGKK